MTIFCEMIFGHVEFLNVKENSFCICGNLILVPCSCIGHKEELKVEVTSENKIPMSKFKNTCRFIYRSHKGTVLVSIVL